jgi:hypothetical protein
MADTKISALTATTTIAGLDVLPIVVDTTGTPVTKKVSIDNFLGQGWIGLGAITYEGADAPSYTFSLASDMTGILSVGMRIKLTDSTVKYFIITGVGSYSGGKTIITVYGGTDYTLSGGAITAGYYSTVKAPFGFPLIPSKWTVETTDTSSRSQASAVAGTWYNLGSITHSVPIGSWFTEYTVIILHDSSSSRQLRTTFSTANNSESDSDFTNGATITGTYESIISYKRKNISVSSKTTYYLLTTCFTAGTPTIYNSNDVQKLVIRSVCAYL